MKLPEKIKGKNRIRDGAIVLHFKRDSVDIPELSARFELSERRIWEILAKNHAFIKRDKEWEKEKRINRLARRLKTVKPSEKDELDILAELRKELEGDKSVTTTTVNVSQNKVIVFRDLEPEEIDRANGIYEQESPASVRAESSL